MATVIIYRNENPQAASETVYKNAPVSNKEVDGNFKSIEDEKIDTVDLSNIFEDLAEELK